MSSMYDDGLDPTTGMPRQPKKQPQQQNSLSFKPTGVSSWLQNPYGFMPGFGGAGIGGGVPNPPSVPNYGQLIKNDPLYLQLQKDLAAQGVSDASQRGALTQRAVALFGQVPQFDALSGLNQDWLNQDVNDTTRQLAEQNTASGMSLAARQQKAFEDQVRAIRNALAARGALQSGELPHQLQQAQLGFDTAKFDATQELLDFISGLQAGFAQAERARQGQLAQGAESAAGRVQEQYPAPVREAVAPAAAAGPLLPPSQKSGEIAAPFHDPGPGGSTATAEARRRRMLLEMGLVG